MPWNIMLAREVLIILEQLVVERRRINRSSNKMVNIRLRNCFHVIQPLYIKGFCIFGKRNLNRENILFEADEIHVLMSVQSTASCKYCCVPHAAVEEVELKMTVMLLCSFISVNNEKFPTRWIFMNGLANLIIQLIFSLPRVSTIIVYR